MRHPVLPVLLGLLLTGAVQAQVEFFGPTPYLSSADTPAGFIDGGSIIEDFEDGVADPRLGFPLGGQIIGPGGLTDSVDADDGQIDGSGSAGRSLFRNSTALSVSFSAPFPTSAGLVWTDGGVSAATFGTFDANGASLGEFGPFPIGDGSNAGTTAEDRFFGVRFAGGISRIEISHTAGGIEIDHIQFGVDAVVEPALFSTLGDGDLAVLMPNPARGLPSPERRLLDGVGLRPHGLAFLDGQDALLADFSLPQIQRAPLDGSAAQQVPLALRSSGNGSLGVAPGRRIALSIGESATGIGEAIALDFAQQPPAESHINGNLRVRGFMTAAIDFDPDGRAFVCHTEGVSVLSPPYTEIDFSMAFPAVVQSPSHCRLSRDGRRLFVTRVLSESQPSLNAVRTTLAPFSADSEFVSMPAPADVQGLGPMAVAPDGQSLLVGQQFLFPPDFAGTRARLFLLRAPFDGNTAYSEISLPASVSGTHCVDGGSPFDCAGFEHIEVSDDGSLAILTGNSSAQDANNADGVAAVFVLAPFDDAAREVRAVPVAPDAEAVGRGTGGVRFLPARLFRDGLESP